MPIAIPSGTIQDLVASEQVLLSPQLQLDPTWLQCAHEGGQVEVGQALRSDRFSTYQLLQLGLHQGDGSESVELFQEGVAIAASDWVNSQPPTRQIVVYRDAYHRKMIAELVPAETPTVTRSVPRHGTARGTSDTYTYQIDGSSRQPRCAGYFMSALNESHHSS